MRTAISERIDGMSAHKIEGWLLGYLEKKLEEHEHELLSQDTEHIPELRGSLPLVIYFDKEEDRQELIEAYKAVHPKSRVTPL